MIIDINSSDPNPLTQRVVPGVNANDPFMDHKMRVLRNQILKDTVDCVNPIWYNTLTEEERNQLAAYRQALLTVPEQAGFPTQIEWPQKPSWL
jgi:hypothetical protein